MLIFSQWTRLLDLLEILLQEVLHMRYLRLDGSTPIKERQILIDTYQTDLSIPIFLLSTKAGGLGINLTAADTVILHDLDFNPENDRQAEDRCHRIGQTKPVTVYKLVVKDTVDEDIFDMGVRKTLLSDAILSHKMDLDEEGEDANTKGKKGGRGKKGKNAGEEAAGGDDDEENGKNNKEDWSMISAMLSKALLRSRQNNLDSTPTKKTNSIRIN